MRGRGSKFFSSVLKSSRVLSLKARAPSPAIGFESSPLGDSQTDCVLLEKSVRQGCRHILVRGTGIDSSTTSMFELITDLAITEDLNVERTDIGYCFTTATTTPFEDKVKAMKELSECMGKGKRVLDYVHLPVPIGGHSLLDKSLLEELVALQRELSPWEINVGLDFHSSALQSLATGEATDDLLKSLDLLRLQDGGGVSSISVATNVLTVHQSRKIINWATRAAGKGIGRVVSTEVLRVHAKRPALIVPFSSPTLASSTALASSSDASERVKKAMEDLKHAVDRCLHLEKQFLEKLKPDLPDVVVTELCWAHLLMQTQHEILSPEEWHFLLTTQILPKLDACTDKLKAAGKAAGEWATLHAGLSRNMFNSFSAMQVRRRELCLTELISALRRNEVQVGTIDDVPRVLASLAASFGASSTMLAGCNTMAPNSPPPPPTTPSAEAVERLFTNELRPLVLELF
jgi:hypothetical protein